MEALLISLGLLVCFNFALKQTFLRLYLALGGLMLFAILVYLLWPYAILQSKTQIAQWVRTPAVMLNISVLITLDVVVHLFFCMRSASALGPPPLSKRAEWILVALRIYPGLMILPTAFAALTYTIFSLPGTGFTLVAGLFALGFALLFALLQLLLRFLRLDREMALELLFLTSVLEALLGVVVTVNGATAVQAVSSVDWLSSLSVLGIVLGGGLAGMLVRRIVKAKNRFAR